MRAGAKTVYFFTCEILLIASARRVSFGAHTADQTPAIRFSVARFGISLRKFPDAPQVSGR
ncbi:hypothetical protein SAMN05421688_2841 [Poseidonocella pacifica]|uniref:Uncharacterized protein n=1 Tax=Poseidonocella pacifica TaxID=871651 RepID=A0A1I0Y7Z8_9RHOB|nr:hypothetical protein SAMN05421688_2841 [Poseidonocella pacifica]